VGVDHPIVGERRLGAIVEPLEELVARLGVAEEVVGLLQECASGVTLVVDNLEEHVVSVAVVGLGATLGVLLRLRRAGRTSGATRAWLRTALWSASSLSGVNTSQKSSG